MSSHSIKARTGASIVVHRTDSQVLRKALGCLRASDAIARIWVIDNSPDTRLRDVVLEAGATYIHTANRGYGAGHNIAIAQSVHEGLDWHLVMNADVWWTGDVPAAMAEYLRQNPDIGMAMPRVRYPDGVLQYACRMLPTPADLILKRFLPPALTARRMKRYLLAEADHDREFNVPYLLGSFLFFRCEALKAEGMFDERFFMYPEDIDITRRIHRHWRTMYWPGAEIVHAHEAASRRSGRMLRIHMANMVRYFNKWGWVFDRERRQFNRRLLRDMPRSTAPQPAGRG